LALMFATTSFIPSQNQSLLSNKDKEDNFTKEAEISLLTTKIAQYPLKEIQISQSFSSFHPGVDLVAPYGDPVKPIRPGVVQEAGFSPLGYGNMVYVDHGDGITSLYGHLSCVLPL